MGVRGREEGVGVELSGCARVVKVSSEWDGMGWDGRGSAE